VQTPDHTRRLKQFHRLFFGVLLETWLTTRPSSFLTARTGYFAKTSVPFWANSFRTFMVPKQLSISYLYRLFHGAVA
jgi:hypothetical protein